MMQEQIQNILQQQFTPLHCDVVNESHLHNVPAGSTTHFKIILVSADFVGLALLARHRKVQAQISTQKFPKLHALSLKLYTPEEWQTVNTADLMSPPCLGGSKE